MTTAIASTAVRPDLACKGVDPDVFFPPPGDTAGEDRAKAICARCPARPGCLDFALATQAEFGVWGGLTETERRVLGSRRVAPPPAGPAPAPRGCPRTRKIPELTPDELARYHAKTAPGGCGVIWTAGTRPDGCGTVYLRHDGKDRTVLAHRLAYLLATGEDPGDCAVIQACGNPVCLTPSCLVLETASDVRRRADSSQSGAAGSPTIPAGDSRRRSAAQQGKAA
jgi:WhiB family redox-sensing transcriptional regulator